MSLLAGRGGRTVKRRRPPKRPQAGPAHSTGWVQRVPDAASASGASAHAASSPSSATKRRTARAMVQRTTFESCRPHQRSSSVSRWPGVWHSGPRILIRNLKPHTGGGMPSRGAPLRAVDLVVLACGSCILGACASGPSGHARPCSAGAFVEVGRVRTLAGTAGVAGWEDGTRASFNSPFRAAVTPDGTTALITDTFNCRIRSVDLSTGEVATFAGEGCRQIFEWEGNATSGARFGHVTAIAISPDGATVLVSDEEHPMIRAIDMAAPRRVRTLAGSPAEAGSHNTADGYGTSASFAQGINGLAFSSDGSRVFAVDNLKIREIVVSISPPAVSTVVASGLQHPAHDIAVSPDDEIVFTAVDGSCDIRTIDIDVAAVHVLAGGGSCSWADGVGTNARFGNVFDAHEFSIDRSPDGSKLLVGDWANHVIRLVDVTTGTVETVAGSGGQGYQDGHATAAKFSFPTGVAFTPDGREAIVVDRYNHLIRAISLGECRNCSAGTYTNVTDAPSCLACPRGKFQSRAGATSCDLCPANTYAALPSSAFCATCPSGTTATPGAAECVCIAGTNCTEPTDQPAGDDACTISRPCDCGTDGCSCGFYRSSACSDYCCPCPAGAYCDCFSACLGDLCSCGRAMLVVRWLKAGVNSLPPPTYHRTYFSCHPRTAKALPARNLLGGDRGA